MSNCITPSVENKQGNIISQSVKFASDNFVHLNASYLGIKISDFAKQKILEKIKQKLVAKGIRISVVTKGCSGLSYKMEYAESGINITEKDEIIECGETKIFIDPKSSLFLFGMQIDYETDGIQSGFKFNNPSSKGSCGCGESFFV
jgi:iron-sulfur cluster assembly protein